MASQAILKDIMDWDEFPEYDMLWTDPPWETRMLRWFDTLQRKQTGTSPQHNLTDLIEQLAALADKHRPTFVEYSVKGWEYVDSIMRANGHWNSSVQEVPQSNGRPFVIMAYNTDYHQPKGLKGGQFITSTVKELGPRTVFDPFAGIGFTYRYVKAGGADYIGSEVNPARYERLVKAIG